MTYSSFNKFSAINYFCGITAFFTSNYIRFLNNTLSKNGRFICSASSDGSIPEIPSTPFVLLVFYIKSNLQVDCGSC